MPSQNWLRDVLNATAKRIITSLSSTRLTKRKAFAGIVNSGRIKVLTPKKHGKEARVKKTSKQ